MKVSLIAYTPRPEKIVAMAAKLCYSSCSIDDLSDELTPMKVESFLHRLSSMHHESPLEHVSFTFAIEGVSRSLLAQITRHRIASFSVQSQRYVRMEDCDMVVPPAIAEDCEASDIFMQAMNTVNSAYDGLCNVLESMHTEKLMIEGMDEKQARAKAKKMANEDARFILPNASATKMIVTMNARELKHFFNLRCCNRAQWEIRELAMEMFKLAHGVAPLLFSDAGPSCLSGPCKEGLMSCGKCDEVRKEFIEAKRLSTSVTGGDGNE